MKAIKGNKSYTVNTGAEANAYLAQGYDVYEDNGTLKNMVSVKQYHLKSLVQ